MTSGDASNSNAEDKANGHRNEETVVFLPNNNELPAGKSKSAAEAESATTTGKCCPCCTRKRCIISTVVVVVVIGLVLLGGYLRYALSLKGKATAADSLDWEDRISKAQLNADFSGTYELASFSDSYEEYLKAFGTPVFVIQHFILKSSERVTITAPADLNSGTWKWDVVTDTSSTSWSFELGVEFSTPWGRDKGTMHKKCSLESEARLMCAAEERDKGWSLSHAYTFSDEGMREELTFITKNVVAKKYYKKLTPEEIAVVMSSSPDAPFSNDSEDEDEDFFNEKPSSG